MLPFIDVIKIRSFRNLWFGQIISQIAFNMMAFTLVLRVYQTTTSNTAVSFLMLVIGIPAIFVGIFAGTMVDRWDKRNVLVATNFIRMVLLLGFFASSETLLWVYVLVFFISVTTQFFVPAEAPTIPRLVAKSLLLTANSLFTFTYYLSMITGFVLSGPMLRLFGPHNVFIFLAALLGLATLFVSQVPPENKNNGQAEFDKSRIVAVWQEFLDGLRFIKKQREIFTSIILLASSQAIIASLASLAPGFADRILEIQIEDASFIILGPAAIGMVVGCLLVGQFGRKQEKRSLINWGIILAGLTLFALSAMFRFKNLPLAFLFLLGLGGANALIDVPANTTLQENVSEELRGRVYGVLASLVGGAAILPVMVAGVMADIFGIGKVIFSIACLITAYGIYRLTKARYNFLKT